jgi:transcription antitermination factor NusG
MAGDDAAQLGDDVIDELREREDTDGFIHFERKRRRRFVNGQLVRVRGGAFGGLDGIVESMSGEERIRILLNLLGRKTPVTICETELAAA